jgi:predicted GIY-YIG superfamily endonuclease
MIIYILELANNKYYVGKSANIEHRVLQHCHGEGSEWTRLHKPIRLIKNILTNDAMDEDKYTKKYMLKHGIENVRGGSYSQITLFDWQIKALENEFRSTRDVCFICGLPGHFSRNCQRKNTNSASVIRIDATSTQSQAVKSVSSTESNQGIIDLSITMHNGCYRQLTVNNDNYIFGILVPYILNRDSERKCGFMYSTGQTNKLYTYEIKQYLRTVIKNKEHMIEMFNTDISVSFGRHNYDSIMDKIYTFIFGEEPPQKAQYIICDNGLGCRGCCGSDVCPGHTTEMLYVDDYGIVYNEYTEIYEKCKGKRNYKFHNTGKLL